MEESKEYKNIMSIKDWIEVNEDDVDGVLATIETNRIFATALASLLMKKKLISKREIMRAITEVTKSEKEWSGK